MALANPANQATPLQRNRKKRPSMVFFSAIYIMVGVGFLFVFFILPAIRVLEARGWRETPCRIVSSQVDEHEGSKGPTYEVDIIFSYHAGGRWLTSSRYDFLQMYSSGYTSKESIVRQYPVGSEAVCYVNPSNPEEAVLYRGYPQGMVFGLIPLVFIGVGVATVLGARMRGAGGGGKLLAPAVLPAPGVKLWGGGNVRREAGDIGNIALGPPGLKQTDASVELAPTITSGYKAMVWTICCVLSAGGLIATIAFNAGDWRANGTDTSGSFVGAIVLSVVTLPILIGTVMAYMQLSDPRVTVRLTPGPLKLGRDFGVEWEVKGGSRRLAQLRIVLECSEEADYGSGRSRTTARSLCYRADLVNAQNGEELAGGTVKLAGLTGVMHSLNTGQNRIVWKMRVIGKVRGWLGVKNLYPVVVMPAGWKEVKA
jgi:hypothetical protein